MRYATVSGGWYEDSWIEYYEVSDDMTKEEFINTVRNIIEVISYDWKGHIERVSYGRIKPVVSDELLNIDCEDDLGYST